MSNLKVNNKTVEYIISCWENLDFILCLPKHILLILPLSEFSYLIITHVYRRNGRIKNNHACRRKRLTSLY